MVSDTKQNASWLVDMPPDGLRRIVDALYRVHRLIAAISDLDALLERVMEESKAVAEAEACSLLLFDPKSEELYFHVALGEEGDQQILKREVRLALGQGIAGAAAADRRSINVPDVTVDPRFYPCADELSRFHTRCILAVPLLEHDTLIGVLEVLNKRSGAAFTEADQRVMEIFSSVVATSITHARLVEENLRAERLSAIGQAVAGLSHYAHNLLAGMSGSMDLIEIAVGRGDLESIGRTWPILKRSTSRIGHFVEDMLAFSKPRKPMRKPVIPAVLVNEAVETYRETLARKHVSLSMDTAQAGGPFPLDEKAVFHCLVNLLKNASEAVREEGGCIAVHARTAVDGSLVIEVADNGAGIRPEHRARLCDPFFSTKGSHGTGLGLAVTRKIVEEHGGQLEIENGKLGGAVFRIRLPRSPEE